MYRIIEVTFHNLGGLIIKKMLEAVSGCKLDTNIFGLPYGKLVTKTCCAKFDIH